MSHTANCRFTLNCRNSRKMIRPWLHLFKKPSAFLMILHLRGPHKPTAPKANLASKVSNDHPVHNFKSGRWNNRYLHEGFRPFSSHNACQICSINNHTADRCKRRYSASPSAQMALHQPLQSDWYPNTSATHHITPDLADLSLSNNYHGVDIATVSNGPGLNIQNIGSSSLQFNSHNFKLNDVLHLPSIHKKLLFVQQFCKRQPLFLWVPFGLFCDQGSGNQDTLAPQPNWRGLYKLPGTSQQINDAKFFFSVNVVPSLNGMLV